MRWVSYNWVEFLKKKDQTKRNENNYLKRVKSTGNKRAKE